MLRLVKEERDEGKNTLKCNDQVMERLCTLCLEGDLREENGKKELSRRI